MPDTCYLDHAGAPIPSKTMVSLIFNDMIESSSADLLRPFGNPHSNVAGSSSDAIKISRGLILSFFMLDYCDYDVIFTSGTTASIKLMCEIFPWDCERSNLCYPFNSHTSLLGTRAFAPNVFVCPSKALRNDDFVEGFSMKDHTLENKSMCYCNNLLLTPGECNFSGVKNDIIGIAKLLRDNANRDSNLLDRLNARRVSNSQLTVSKEQENMKFSDHWLWCLDAAKLAATSALDLSFSSHPELKAFRPHFVTVSFYKMFGYPTGLGALLIRRDVEPMLRKSYYGGGTLAAAAADSMFEARKADMHDYMEDGTPNFYAIAALPRCFEFIQSIGGMETIQERTFQLTKMLAQGMAALKHANGQSLCTLYGWSVDATSTTQGPVIAFNLQSCKGNAIGFSEVAKLAESNNIHLRVGCFCNVGACQEWLGISAEEVEENYRRGRVCDGDSHDLVNGRHTGAVRVSLGFSSSEKDCVCLLQFLSSSFLDRVVLTESDLQFGDLTKIPSDAIYLYNEVNTDHDLQSIWARSDLSVDLKEEVEMEASNTTIIDNSNDIYRSLTLSAIYVYPIKSCGGMRVSSWPVGELGLLFDREWTIVDSAGRALTQKSHPRLSLVRAAVDLQSLLLIVRAPVELCKETLVVSIATAAISAPASSSSGVESDSEHISVTVCGRHRSGMAVSSDADAWFTSFLGAAAGPPVSDGSKVSNHPHHRYRLVSRCNTESGEQTMNGAIENGQQKLQASFSNQAPFLLISEESVRALVGLIAAEAEATGISRGKIRVENFRPNIVVSGAEQPHEEDRWESLLIGHDTMEESFPFRRFCSLSHPNGVVGNDSTISNGYNNELKLMVSGPCARCAMVNVDGSSGSFDCRAFEALAEYRRRGREVHFGQFLQFPSSLRIADREDIKTTDKIELNQILLGVLRVGDRLKVKKKQDYS